MRKSKNRMYRWIAVVLTAALLVGQCQVPVLAKEESAPVETGVSAENKADAQEDGDGATDKDAPKESDTDNGGAGDGVGGGAGDGGVGEGGSGAENGGTGEGGSGTDNNGTDGAGGGAENGGTGEGGSGTDNGGSDGAGGGADNSGTGEGGSGMDNGGTDSVGGGNGTGNGGMDGAGDDANNGGADDAGENVSGAGDVGTGDEDEDKSGEDGALNKCVCETACTEDAVNVDCPVCAADYSACVQNAGGGVKPSEGIVEEGTVSENDLDGEDGIALLAADEGVEVLAVGEEFEDSQGVKYRVINEDDKQVEVIGHRDLQAVSGKVTIPQTVDRSGYVYRVTSIGDGAFSGTSLQNIEISSGVTSIGKNAFLGCKALTKIKIPDGVTNIKEGTFSGCLVLSDIEIPNSVVSVDQKAFSDCAVRHIEIPDSVKRIGQEAFLECRVLISIKIPDGVKKIEDSTFSGCRNLSSIEIPDSVTDIGREAFYNCINLRNVDIPNSVKIIGDYAFYHSGLRSIKIPSNISSIQKYAFSWCQNLVSVEIETPSSITSIGDYAFRECTILSDIEIPSGVIDIGGAAFENCHGISSIKIPYGVKNIGSSAFSNCSNLVSVEIPNSVVNIGGGAFSYCKSLEYIEIPDSVNSIKEATFMNCKNLKYIKMPNSVTTIEKSAFAGAGLINVKIPNNVMNIEDNVFGFCADLEKITFTTNLKHIGRLSLRFCYKLNVLQIVVSSDGKIIPPGVATDFADIPKDRSIVFLGENGKVLKGSDFEKAKAAYLGDSSDGDVSDNLWWGWKIEEPSAVDDAYSASINVRRNDAPWTAHNRTFALTKDSATTFTIALDAVEPGTYTIYDVTGLTADEFQSKGVNTGVTVPVEDADVSATVDYYTATFYDLDADGKEVEYRDSTDQRPQTILKTAGRVTKPVTDPVKEGHTFEKWVTAPGREEEFNFASTVITSPTKIYAKWKVNTAPTHTVTVNVKKDGNPWSGHGRIFALLGGGGSGFLEATGQAGDSTYSISQVSDGTYRIYDITGVPADSLYSRAGDTGAEVRVGGADTGVDVTVNGADVEKDVHYYIATFYDGTDAYKTGTLQEPQIILRGKTAAKPEDPQKTDWQFAGWKTTKDGDTAYDFDTPVTDVTSIFASWVEKTAEQLHIRATATEGGTISPAGDIAVTKNGEQSFTITPNEGYKIQAVTADGDDVTAELKKTLVRAQTGARYYTFSNVTENHTIHAAFEADSGDKPGEGDDNPGGDDDNPDDGDNPGDDDDNPGDDRKPGGGEKDDGSDNNSSGGGSGTTPDTSTGDGAETTQVTVVSQTSGIQTSGDQGASAAGKAANGSEPKTDDTTYVEIYATVAMIAGLTYLLLYFMEEGRGMTEREKEVFVAAFIRWAKKGGRFRRCCAVAAIFCLLVYYHSIGKRVRKSCFDRECLRQAL